MITLGLIALPLVSAVLLLFMQGESTKKIAFIATLIELGLALAAVAQFTADASVQFAVNFPWVASAGINFSLGMDGISLLLVILTTFLMPWIVLSTFKHHYKNPSAFYALILFMQAALIGVFTAQDAVLFYLFWEAALIPVYFLAGIWGGERRVAVTFKFFIYTIFGSLFMLVALAYLYFQTPGNHSSSLEAFYALKLDESAQCYVFWALFLAFGIKMPVFPFHTWQPDTYTEAPTPATMLLSGIMLKMGIYGVIRWLLPVVPQAAAHWGTLAIVLSVIGIIYGSIIAIKQQNVKRLIAYSSFAHVGLMAAGVFSLTQNGLQGAMVQMLSHGINVVGLFFIVEIIYSRIQTHEIERMGGITRNTPALTIFFMILMLGSVALPLTNGFVGEFLLLSGVFQYNVWFGAIAGVTIILGAVYMLRMFQGVMFGEQSSLTTNFGDISFVEKATLFPLALMVFWIGLYPAPFLNMTAPAVEHLLQVIAR
ncbi:NADH-quinone oxidoreductase subunit M [Flexibacter flexilis DSM 6793]|uniref:NADH-quinone oxidoreductase subunit M n=1 Tax=Flexibacter flexilis DSM 6793 TaxID=927664 RepID=A0A1I1DN80_9BACT|nr:NADH-quinone oxidoreductase subunit M [Flexibacter flexilis]SFB74130.1 NADH-quinone oxidoreductase subunit M [Flexibacter flexilis DSM 6793]